MTRRSPTPPPRRRWPRRLLVAGVTLATVAMAAVVTGALAWHRLAGAVHHVAIAPAAPGAAGTAALAGGTTVLVAVRLPTGRSHVVVLHDRAGRADVLALPDHLRTAAGRPSARVIDEVAPEAAHRLVATVESLGVPVAHYVGLDLAHVAPASPLGQLMAGHRSATSIAGDPLAAGAVLSGLVHHLVLDRGTSLRGAIGLLGLRSCRPQQLPVARVGRVAVPDAAARAVVARFLRTVPAPSCRAPVGALITG